MAQEKTPAAEGPSADRRRAFLYVGSADATIKLQFLKGLRGHSITQYPYHRTVTSGSPTQIVEAFRTCRDDGYDRVVVVCDIHEDGYTDSLGTALEGLAAAFKRGLLSGCKTVEFFVEAENESDAQNLIETASSLLSSFGQAPPHAKLYILSNPGMAIGRKPGLAALLTAFTIAAPSRMAGVGEGLDAIRSAPGSALFLARYEESSVPKINETARVAVDTALLDGTFSPLPDQRSPPPSANQIERLLAQHKVGIEEPPLATSFQFEFKYAMYRDALLHPLMSTLVRRFPEEATLLEAMDSLTNEVSACSPALRLLLADLRNAIVAARTRVCADLRTSDIESLGPRFDEDVRDIVGGFIQQFRFAIWPLLGQRVKPQSEDSGIRGLQKEYEKCISSAADELREMVTIDLRTHQEAMKKAMTDTALRLLPGRWRLPPKSLLFVHQQAVRPDRRDELWPDQLRSGFLGLLQRELRA